MTFPYIEKGNRLRKIIEDSFLTQKRFAEQLGVSQGYLTQIVNGYKDLSGTILEGIAVAYGNKYNIIWLLTGEGEMLNTEYIPQADKISGPADLHRKKPSMAFEDIPEKFSEMLEDIKAIKKILEKEFTNKKG